MYKASDVKTHHHFDTHPTRRRDFSIKLGLHAIVLFMRFTGLNQ
jgi:hypothetical protein